MPLLTFPTKLGVLNAWKWPSIEGLHSFKGDLVHTARWKADLVTKGRRVAVVGSGSSGIQVLATIQPEAKQVYHWIRERFRAPALSAIQLIVARRFPHLDHFGFRSAVRGTWRRQLPL